MGSLLSKDDDESEDKGEITFRLALGFLLFASHQDWIDFGSGGGFSESMDDELRATDASSGTG
jgi:hypothetical protein